MQSTLARQHWRRAADDALHVAEVAHALGKYPVAAFLCHRAVGDILRGAFGCGRPKSGKNTNSESLVDGFLARCSDSQRTLAAELAAVAAAWTEHPEYVAAQATQSNTRRWIDGARRMLVGLLG